MSKHYDYIPQNLTLLHIRAQRCLYTSKPGEYRKHSCLLLWVNEPTSTSLCSAPAHATGNTIMNCVGKWAESIVASHSLIHCSGLEEWIHWSCFSFNLLSIPHSSCILRKRNILSPNEQFGTRGCYSGFEGLVNEYDLFSSCHIRIFEPNLYQRHTRLLQCSAVFGVLCVVGFASCCWKSLLKREARRHRQQNMVKETSTHAFAYAEKPRKKKQ